MKERIAKSKKKRATFYLDEDLKQKINAFCYWERKNISDTINQILYNFFANKDIAPIPEKNSILN